MNEFLFHGSLVTTNRILYTPSSFTKSNLLHLQETGVLQAQRPHTSSRKNLASYLFFVVEDGSGSLQYNDQEYALEAGDCVFIDCRNPYAHYTSDKNLWKLCWVHFDGPTMEHIYKRYIKLGGAPTFHPHNVDSFLIVMRELYEIADSNEYVKDMSIQGCLASLLTLIMKESWHPELNSRRSSPKKQTLFVIKEYLDEHYAERITLDELSETFFINKFYLTRVFKEQYGVSITNYLSAKRITHAKQLLRFTDETIEKLCVECGIEDANYFTRLFKKVEGVTPGEYRKMWQG